MVTVASGPGQLLFVCFILVPSDLISFAMLAVVTVSEFKFIHKQFLMISCSSALYPYNFLKFIRKINV